MDRRTHLKPGGSWLIAWLVLIGLMICPWTVAAQADGGATATPTALATNTPPVAATSATPALTATATQPPATAAPPPTATRPPATMTPPPTATATRPPATATAPAVVVSAPLDTATPSATPDCPDGYEPDDERATQARLLLTNGTTQLHSFHKPGDPDYVKFVAQQGQVVSLYTYNLAAGVDTFLTLFNADGGKLTDNDTDPTNPAGSRIIYAFSQTDTYYLEVKHVNPAAGGCALTYTLAATAIQPTPTPTATTQPGQPHLEIFRFYTVPDVVRFYEPFELFVTVRNAGTAAAQDVVFGLDLNAVANQASGFIADDNSSRNLGRLEIGQQTTTSKRYRYVPAPVDYTSIDGNGQPTRLGVSLTGSPVNLYIRVFKGLPIADPTVVFTRTLTKPNIIVRRSWTAPENNLDPGAARDINPNRPFELVVDLHNIGQVEADNVYIDFVVENDETFFPVGSTAQKYVPGSLGPDGHAFASQTLRFQSTPTPDTTQWFTLTIFYNFTYAGQRVQEKTTQKIAIVIDSPPAAAVTNAGLGQGAGEGYVAPASGTPANVQVPESGAAALAAAPLRAAALAGAPQVIVPSYTTDPALPRPGEPFVLTLIVFNASEAAIRNLLLSWPAGDLLAPVSPAGASRLLGYLGPQQTQQVAFQLVASDSANSGRFTYPVRFEYENGLGSQMTGLQNLDIPLATAGSGKGQPETATGAHPEALVALDSYTTEPATIAAGQPFMLTVVLRNLGLADARQVTVAWLGEVIAPLGSGQTQYLPALAAGQTATLTGRFYLLGRAEGELARAPIQIGFENSAGVTLKRQEQVSLLVAGQPASMSQASTGLGAATAVPPPAASAGRPFLLRLLLALLGLGGQP